MEVICLNNFPNNNEEIELIKFIAKYQYLNVNDAKYFFSSKTYYLKRITNLIKKRYIRKVKANLVLDKLGTEYAKAYKFDYTPLNRNQKYNPRLLYISHLAAFYHKSNNVEFYPSFAMKEKDVFTIRARKFVGILEIDGIDYLTYKISSEDDKKYIMSIIYDIQKEKKYRNIIVLVDNITRININDFAFGMNKILVVEDTQYNRESLKYLHRIDWSKLISGIYKKDMYLSEYNFCDYTDHKNKYISIFYFLDAEKITRIKYFLRENKNKNIDIICSKEMEKCLKKEFPNSNYIVLDIEKYIDKERNIYE